MAETTPATPPRPTVEPDDWPTQAADAIVTQVGKVRDKTTGPALTAARYVIFAAFAILLGTVALIIFVIGAVRALDVYLPDAIFGEVHTWAAHTLLGLLFVIGGLVTSRKMHRPGT